MLLAASLSLVAVACDEEPDPRSAAPTEAPSASVTQPPSPAASPVCPDQLAAATVGNEGVFEGRIDADEIDDSAYLFDDGSTDGDCGLLLVVETGVGGKLASPIVGADAGIGPVAIRHLARVDERPGAEIVVRMLTGASTEFFGVFSLGSGSLERVEIEGIDPYGDLFPSGGSVGHLEASDCASNSGDDGAIVVSLATPQGDGYKLVRTFYTSTQGVLTIDDVVRARIDDPQDLEAYQEFFGTPFGTCAAGT